MFYQLFKNFRSLTICRIVSTMASSNLALAKQSFLSRRQMHVAAPSTSHESNDSDVLKILWSLSDLKPPDWDPQFPFLDAYSVNQVTRSISHILSNGKTELKKQILPLIRKWCTGRNKSDVPTHCAWIGRLLSVRDCVELTFSACLPHIENPDDWNKRDPEQQLAVCYAVLGAATNSPTPLHPKAGDMCALLVERILSLKVLTPLHHRFLAQVWSSVGELPIKLDVLILMIERSNLGIEKMMVWLGKRAMCSDQYSRAESFKTVVGSTLLRVCCQSPKVFQKICYLLVHMMVISEAHPGIQGLTNHFISGVEEECRKVNIDICSLYEEPCQVLSALLCVEPSLLQEHGDYILSRQTILRMLNELPRPKAACLLSHRPNWLLYTF